MQILFGQSLGGAVAIDLASKNSSTVWVTSTWAILCQAYISFADKRPYRREYFHFTPWRSPRLARHWCFFVHLQPEMELGLQDTPYSENTPHPHAQWRHGPGSPQEAYA